MERLTGVAIGFLMFSACMIVVFFSRKLRDVLKEMRAK